MFYHCGVRIPALYFFLPLFFLFHIITPFILVLSFFIYPNSPVLSQSYIVHELLLLLDKAYQTITFTLGHNFSFSVFISMFFLLFIVLSITLLILNCTINSLSFDSLLSTGLAPYRFMFSWINIFSPFLLMLI